MPKLDVRDSVLITGGTGYLGRALTWELLNDPGCRKICIYSRGEAGQAAMKSDYGKLDPDGKLRFFIGDVRDRNRLSRAMDDVDTIIHAAALKRVEVGEYNPMEMMKTNVIGTMNVVDAALDNTVFRVLLISSDKACEPLNAYGASKLCAEKIVLGAENTKPADGPKFAVVRYGNVAGSTGSVIPVWRKQIAEGAEYVTISDPACRRFFMHVSEAVALVLWTLTFMDGGETVVPILPAYSLHNLAEAMGTPYNVTGIGYGEKHDEAMIGTYEAPHFYRHGNYLVRPGTLNSLRTFEPMGNIVARDMSVEELRAELAKVK